MSKGQAPELEVDKKRKKFLRKILPPNNPTQSSHSKPRSYQPSKNTSRVLRESVSLPRNYIRLIHPTPIQITKHEYITCDIE